MKRTNLDAWIERIEGIDHLTRENLEALQLRRLNELLARAREAKGHYAGLPEKLDSLKELCKLPFATPEMLGENPGRYLLTSQRDVTKVISGATSGTTGPAKRVFYTERDTARTVWLFEAGIGEMLHPGEKCLIAFPFTGPFGLGDLIARAVENLGAIPIKAGFGLTWAEQKAILMEHRPECYIGFPVPLLGLARYCGEELPLKRVLVSGDACPQGVMAELNGIFGGETYPHYGSRECGLGGAVTCPAHEGMHLRENHIIPEIIDEKGNVLPDGEFGELVLTTIGQEAMPLIRYRTGDYTRILPPCPCGGVTRRLDRTSRAYPDALDMEEMDSRLFRIPGLVDYRAYLEEGAVHYELLMLPGFPVPELENARIAICTGSEKPMYPAKRYVQKT